MMIPKSLAGSASLTLLAKAHLWWAIVWEGNFQSKWQLQAPQIAAFDSQTAVDSHPLPSKSGGEAERGVRKKCLYP
jgi:hypothetical protein